MLLHTIRCTTFLALSGISAWAQAPEGPPPAAKVTVCTLEVGTIARTQLLPGNIFFKEVSNVATEVNGKVVEVLFEEGQHLDKGAVMVRLDHVLLDSDLQAAQAAVLQSETETKLQQARLDRALTLLKDEVTTPQEYDDIRFTAQASEHRVGTLKAEVERIEREIEKKTIRAPFSGQVIERIAELGDWRNIGQTIAVFARDDVLDVMVNVPEKIIPFIKDGLEVDVTVGETILTGTVVTVIPRGDMADLLFPVKIRIDRQPGLLEGMSAYANLPAGEETQCLLVPRDAVIQEGNQYVVYRVDDTTPVREQVDIIGYKGLLAGIESKRLQPGMQVITKGQERLRPGQAVEIVAAS
ncbi:MAG: efflux RND transporter periplasmic adaptor subunit [Candidatus Hydrogenedentes bacterium]|nr:efflux RND transporter periplasmic adaptor subunit [Candidatus Hydrogenedentota bacterium]